MSWKGCGRKQLWPNRGTTKVWAGKDWEEQGKSLRVTSAPAEIWNEHFWNLCLPLHQPDRCLPLRLVQVVLKNCSNNGSRLRRDVYIILRLPKFKPLYLRCPPAGSIVNNTVALTCRQCPTTNRSMKHKNTNKIWPISLENFYLNFNVKVFGQDNRCSNRHCNVPSRIQELG
jgi:hypothetical protein